MSDNNWISYADQHRPDVSGFVNPENPKDYDDVMKFSNCTSVLVSNLTVRGGRENALDVVRGSDYTFLKCDFVGGGEATITIKGAVRDWCLTCCGLMAESGRPHIELGQFDNYWRPGRKPTSLGEIAFCRNIEGGPIRIRIWDADRPAVICTAVKITKIPWIIWFPYFLYRYISRRVFKTS